MFQMSHMFQMSKVRQWQHVQVASIHLADLAAVCQCSAERSEKLVSAGQFTGETMAPQSL